MVKPKWAQILIDSGKKDDRREMKTAKHEKDIINKKKRNFSKCLKIKWLEIYEGLLEFNEHYSKLNDMNHTFAVSPHAFVYYPKEPHKNSYISPNPSPLLYPKITISFRIRDYKKDEPRKVFYQEVRQQFYSYDQVKISPSEHYKYLYIEFINICTYSVIRGDYSKDKSETTTVKPSVEIHSSEFTEEYLYELIEWVLRKKE